VARCYKGYRTETTRDPQGKKRTMGCLKRLKVGRIKGQICRRETTVVIVKLVSAANAEHHNTHCPKSHDPVHQSSGWVMARCVEALT